MGVANRLVEFAVSRAAGDRFNHRMQGLKALGQFVFTKRCRVAVISADLGAAVETGVRDMRIEDGEVRPLAVVDLLIRFGLDILIDLRRGVQCTERSPLRFSNRPLRGRRSGTP